VNLGIGIWRFPVDDFLSERLGKVVDIYELVVIIPQSLEGLSVSLNVVVLSVYPRTVDFEAFVVAGPPASRLVNAPLERDRVSLLIMENTDLRVEDTPIPLFWNGDFDIKSFFAEKPSK